VKWDFDYTEAVNKTASVPRTSCRYGTPRCHTSARRNVKLTKLDRFIAFSVFAYLAKITQSGEKIRAWVML
jgi:hypothetical protein